MDLEGEFEVVEPAKQGVNRKKERALQVEVNNHKLKKLNYKHLAIMDMILYSPNMTMTEIAKRLNGTVSWVSLVVGSDLFQEELRNKRVTLDEFKREQLSSRLLDSGTKALDRLDKILDNEDASDSVASTAAKNVLTGLGFMSTNTPAPGVNIQVNGDNANVSALGVTSEMLKKVKDRRS